MNQINIMHYSEIPEKYTGIVVWKQGFKFWYKNGDLHREDGPAIESANYNKWWLNGVELTEEEFNKRMKK